MLERGRRTPSDESDGRVLWAIIAAGLLLRTAVLLWYLSSHGGRPETWEYEVVARRLLAGEGLSFPYLGSIYRSYYAPLFPAFCAALHWIAGPGLGLYYGVQLAIAAAIIFLVSRIAAALFGREAGLWAAALAAVEPGLILYQSYKVDPAAAATLLVLISMAAFLRLRAGGGSLAAIVSGLAAGAGMLVRPDAVAVLAAPLVWSAWGGFREGRRLLIVLAAAAVPLLPWIARNYRLHGRLMATSSLSGQLLWTGNNPASTGTLWTRGGGTQVDGAPDELKARLMGAGELSNNDVYGAEAIRYISDDKVGFLSRCVKKIWYFWWFPPDYSGRRYYRWVPSAAVVGYRLLWLGLLALAILGSWRTERKLSALLWAPPIALSAIHSLYYVEGRHRILILPLLLILSSHGLKGLAGLIAARRDTALLPGRPGAGS